MSQYSSLIELNFSLSCRDLGGDIEDSIHLFNILQFYLQNVLIELLAYSHFVIHIETATCILFGQAKFFYWHNSVTFALLCLIWLHWTQDWTHIEEYLSVHLFRYFSLVPRATQSSSSPATMREGKVSRARSRVQCGSPERWSSFLEWRGRPFSCRWREFINSVLRNCEGICQGEDAKNILRWNTESNLTRLVYHGWMFLVLWMSVMGRLVSNSGQ